ncbi:MAG: putative signal transduction histidine kinase, partial [Comamonadaceae bacterium]
MTEFRAGYWFFVLLLTSLTWPAQALVLELRQAQAMVTTKGQTTQQLVNLPYHWDRQHPGLAGEAVFELPFELDQLPTVPFGLYVPRLGNAYEVWLNGVLLQRQGDLQNYNGSDFAKAPRYVVIHPGLWRTHNLLLIRIRADVGRRGGLAALHLGPDEEVYPLYLHDYLWRSLGSLVIVIVSLLIGGVAMALWATQVNVSVAERPRRDALYLYAGLAELCWAAAVGNALIEN